MVVSRRHRHSRDSSSWFFSSFTTQSCMMASVSILSLKSSPMNLMLPMDLRRALSLASSSSSWSLVLSSGYCIRKEIEPWWWKLFCTIHANNVWKFMVFILSGIRDTLWESDCNYRSTPQKTELYQKFASTSDFWNSVSVKSRLWIPISKGWVALASSTKKNKAILHIIRVSLHDKKATDPLEGKGRYSSQFQEDSDNKVHKPHLSVKILTALAASSSFCFFSKTSSSALSFSNSFWQRFSSSFRKFTVLPGLSAMGTFSCIQTGKAKAFLKDYLKIFNDILKIFFFIVQNNADRTTGKHPTRGTQLHFRHFTSLVSCLKFYTEKIHIPLT